MLDLKSKLAAAGVVTTEQVKTFEEKEAKKREQKRQARNNGSTDKGGPRGGKGGARRDKSKRTKRGGKVAKERAVVPVAHLKSLKKGEAYDRIRKIVGGYRLDDGERTIPGPDDKTFNFVTAKGRISKLYLRDATIAELSGGRAAISAFMSHHGLAHCVLEKEHALAIAQVFPLWLRHLDGHPEAGKLEADEVDTSTAGTSPKEEGVEAQASFSSGNQASNGASVAEAKPDASPTETGVNAADSSGS